MVRAFSSERKIAILYEHPEWFKPLFAELDRRGIGYEHWLAHEHRYDPAVRSLPVSLVINRMSPSSYLRGHGNGIFYALQLLAYLKNRGVPVINGYDAFVIETSKALQAEIFEELSVPYPRSRVINQASLAAEAAEGFSYPVIVKPNIGGSGAKIQKFPTRASLQQASRAGSIDLGFDSTALVQEFLPARGNSIVRVEILDREFLYAIKIRTEGDGNFNLCPADICQDESQSKRATSDQDLSRCPASTDGGKRRLQIEAVTPPRSVIDAALRIANRAHLDVGGIEYLINERDGEVYFYDVNSLSNFVTDAERIVGFDPYARFVEFVLDRVYLAVE